jgi:ParB family chromosome partitioning protein
MGHNLKLWLFGGSAIPASNALFGLDDYKGRMVADLFGEDSYFVDTAKFWELQNQAVAAKREALLADGWADVEILDDGQRFDSWNHQTVV